MFLFSYFIFLITSNLNCEGSDTTYTETLNINAQSIANCKDKTTIYFEAGTIAFSQGSFEGFNNLEEIYIYPTQKAAFYKSSLSNFQN